MSSLTFYDALGCIGRTYTGENLQAQIDNKGAHSVFIGLYNPSEYYFNNHLPISKPIKPHRFAVFNYTTKSWEVDLEKVKGDAVKRIKQLTQDYIYASYAQPKQANMQARTTQLQLVASGGYPDGNGGFIPARALTAAEIAELSVISSAWEWIGLTRHNSDAIEVLLNNAANTEDIEGIVADYKAGLT